MNVKELKAIINELPDELTLLVHDTDFGLIDGIEVEIKKEPVSVYGFIDDTEYNGALIITPTYLK